MSGAAIFRAVAVMVLLAASASSAQAQATNAVGDAGPGLKGIGLTPVQRRFIYENTSGDRQQQVPRAQVALGAEVPDALILNEMPIHVKDEIGLLRDFKFAVVEGAQSVLIVDPASRKVVDIVSKDDAAK
jgi:hypothetical protein